MKASLEHAAEVTPLELRALSHEALASWSVEAAPEEACGLILAKPGASWPQDQSDFVTTRCMNSADEAENSFLIDPLEWISHERTGRGMGLEARGYWHSHPSSTAKPSRRDVEMASDLGRGAHNWLFAIVGLEGERKAESCRLRVYRLSCLHEALPPE